MSKSKPSKQRQRLIDACIAALHLHGPSRTTVEKVVALADLSPGIVRFYFDSKDALLVASLAYLAAEFEERVMRPVAALRDDPVRALERLIELYFDADIASARKVSVWYSFWGEASSRQEYYEICGRKDDEFAALVRELIARLIAAGSATHLDADGVALGLIGVLEVLWQDIAFNEEARIDRAAAQRRSLAYLRSVFPECFASQPGGAGTLFAPWAYRDPALAALERQRLFGQVWQVFVHEESLREPGASRSLDTAMGRALALRDVRHRLEVLGGDLVPLETCSVRSLLLVRLERPGAAQLAGAVPASATIKAPAQTDEAQTDARALVETLLTLPRLSAANETQVEELPVDWKTVVEQWLAEPQAAGRTFLFPNHLLERTARAARLRQVIPLAAGRCRLRTLELVPAARGRGGKLTGRRTGSTPATAAVSIEDASPAEAPREQFRRRIAELIELRAQDAP